MGLEPTRAERPQEPESCSSANSDTSAYRVFQLAKCILHGNEQKVKHKIKKVFSVFIAQTNCFLYTEK